MAIVLLLLFVFTIGGGCVYRDYDSPFDMHEESGQLNLLLMLNAGLGSRPRIGYSWRLVNSSAAFTPRSNPLLLVFRERLWVLGGFDTNGDWLSDAWSSPDGVVWTRIASSLPVTSTGTRLAGAVFQGRMWIFDNTRAYASTDGASWSLIATIPSAITIRSAFVYGGLLQVVDPEGVTVNFQSGDGITWSTREFLSGTFGDYADIFFADGFSRYTFGNRIGHIDSERKFEELAELNFFPHRVLPFDGRFWAFGADVQYSRDGLLWTGTTPLNLVCCREPQIPRRILFDITVFQNSFWFVGGIDQSGTVRNDVWQSLGGGQGADGELRSDGSL
ncbi:MAG: hypothetical protein NXI24_08175 [bacterium]|nr:hypothetical protein [bacterium]